MSRLTEANLAKMRHAFQASPDSWRRSQIHGYIEQQTQLAEIVSGPVERADSVNLPLASTILSHIRSVENVEIVEHVENAGKVGKVENVEKAKKERLIDFALLEDSPLLQRELRRRPSSTDSLHASDKENIKPILDLTFAKQQESKQRKAKPKPKNVKPANRNAKNAKDVTDAKIAKKTKGRTIAKKSLDATNLASLDIGKHLGSHSAPAGRMTVRSTSCSLTAVASFAETKTWIVQ